MNSYCAIAGVILSQKSLFWHKKNVIRLGGHYSKDTKALITLPFQPPPFPWSRVIYLEPADVICSSSNFLHTHIESNNFVTWYDSVDAYVT